MAVKIKWTHKMTFLWFGTSAAPGEFQAEGRGPHAQPLPRRQGVILMLARLLQVVYLLLAFHTVLPTHTHTYFPPAQNVSSFLPQCFPHQSQNKNKPNKHWKEKK